MYNKNQTNSFFATLLNDFRTTEFYKSFRRQSKDIQEFYLTEQERKELQTMNRLRGWFFIMLWILKAMFKKLTPERRILFALGLFSILDVHLNNKGEVNGVVYFGSVALILLILLELKDKLLAHDELREGRRIQEALMPEPTPNVEGWTLWLFTRSANDVCGDLVDFLPRGNQRYGVAIADVAGKGLHAALLTAKLQATIRALAFEYNSLPQLIAKVNTIFRRDSPAHMFASLFYVELQENNGSICFVNAGHPPALIVHNNAIKESSKGELALGLKHDSTYSEQAITLNNGESFILYSDGITEASNEAGEFFGTERLRAFLKSKTFHSAQHLGTTLVAEVDRFVGTVQSSDDLSLIVLQRK